MSRGYGSRAQLAIAFETVYGTKPASGFLRVPFAGHSLRSAQSMTPSELLGYGRDPQDPTFEGETVVGEVTIPVESVAIGHWMKAVFGAPSTTGTGPYVHTFSSAGASLPSLSIEAQYPDVPAFEMFTGIRADGFRITGARTGQLQMRIPLIGRSYSVDTTQQAGP